MIMLGLQIYVKMCLYDVYIPYGSLLINNDQYHIQNSTIKYRY